MVALDTAVVLAAGMGRRMGVLSRFYPKPLIPVANKPVIDWVFSSLSNAGVRRFIVVVGYMGSVIKRHIERYFSNVDVKCVYADDYVKGAGYSLLAAEGYVSGDFLLSPADLILDPKIVSGLIKASSRLGVPLLATGSAKRQGTAISTSGGMCGSVVSMKKGCGVERVCIGLVALDSSFFNCLRRSINNGEGSVVSALDLYIREGGCLKFIDFPETCWFDVDTITEVLKVNSYLLNAGIIPQNNFYVPPGEVWSLSCREESITRSTVFGPVLFNPECSIEGSKLGPNVSLNGGVSCKKAIVSDAVVFGRCKLKGVVKSGILFNNMFFSEGTRIEQVPC
nr:hypothetical protein [Candidatus Bathyarchaeota archaeon]